MPGAGTQCHLRVQVFVAADCGRVCSCAHRLTGYCNQSLMIHHGCCRLKILQMGRARARLCTASSPRTSSRPRNGAPGLLLCS